MVGLVGCSPELLDAGTCPVSVFPAPALHVPVQVAPARSQTDRDHAPLNDLGRGHGPDPVGRLGVFPGF